ncbi:hypothetical protein [Novosphingobium sp. THN1]|uniref:hypothetical protein n=1 Tax=Novosphingobium sp. THN1 TaxID=1016987 RepID=UPI0019682203|nr:hypothetical protein [Novosphingobium sp. THN1]
MGHDVEPGERMLLRNGKADRFAAQRQAGQAIGNFKFAALLARHVGQILVMRHDRGNDQGKVDGALDQAFAQGIGKVVVHPQRYVRNLARDRR